MASTTTLTLSGLTLADAQEIADHLEGESCSSLAVSINETDESRGLWNVVAYYPNLRAARTAGQKLAGRPNIHGEPQFEALPEIGWVERSLKALGPVTAGRFFLYGAHDRNRRRIGGISLEIDAGTAFGTGHHATTIGCLLAFERLCKRRLPRHVLDVGAGTGVLAMAAAKAIRRLVIASDIDPEAMRVALHNAAVNGLRPWIRAITAAGLRHATIAKAAPYDLIFANILARPLIALAPDITGALAPGGQLILSGLTGEQMRPVLAAYRDRGVFLESKMQIGQWPTLTLTETRKRPGQKGAGRSSTRDYEQFGKRLSAPNHPVNVRPLHADISQQPVVKLLKLALGPRAADIGRDTAGNAVEEARNETQSFAAVGSASIGDYAHDFSPFIVGRLSDASAIGAVSLRW